MHVWIITYSWWHCCWQKMPMWMHRTIQEWQGWWLQVKKAMNKLWRTWSNRTLMLIRKTFMIIRHYIMLVWLVVEDRSNFYYRLLISMLLYRISKTNQHLRWPKTKKYCRFSIATLWARINTNSITSVDLNRWLLWANKQRTLWTNNPILLFKKTTIAIWTLQFRKKSLVKIFCHLSISWLLLDLTISMCMGC